MGEAGDTNNGWKSHGELVMYRLDASEKRDSEIMEKLDDVLRRVTIIETKSGIIGAIAGAVSGIAAAAASILGTQQ